MSASLPAELVLFVRAVIRELILSYGLSEPQVSVCESNSIDLCYRDENLYCTIGTPEDGMLVFIDTYSTCVAYKDYSEAQAKMLAAAIFRYLC